MEKKRIKDLIKKIFSGEWGISADEFDFNKINKPMERVSVIRTANFKNDGGIDYSNIVERVIDKKNVEAKQLKSGDIIIEKSGGSPNQPVGRVVFFDLETRETFLSNNFTAVIRVKEKIASRFLFYNLFFLHQVGKTQKYQSKTTGILNLKLSDFIRETVLLPDLKTQNRIVAILDRTHNLIQKRQQSIEMLDELIKTVFWDMFGDPYLNNKNWEIVNVDDVVESIKAGSSVSGIHRKLIDNEIAVLKVSAVTKGFFNPEEYKVVNKEKIKKPIITIKRGDILFTRANTMDLVAATCIVDKDYPYLFLPDKIWKIQLKDNLVKPNYFKMVLSNNGYRKALALKATGSSGSMVNISQEKLKNNNFPLASLKLQSQFEEFVTLVDRIKVLLKNSLESNQILFQSFLQKAFKGELDFEKEKILEDILPNLKLEELLSDLKLLKSLLDKLQNQNFKTGSNYKLAQNLLFQLLDNKKSGVFQQCDVETENLEIKHEAN